MASFLVCEWDSNISKQVSGGHLLDAGWTESTSYAVPFGTAAVGLPRIALKQRIYFFNRCNLQ